MGFQIDPLKLSENDYSDGILFPSTFNQIHYQLLAIRVNMVGEISEDGGWVWNGVGWDQLDAPHSGGFTAGAAPEKMPTVPNSHNESTPMPPFVPNDKLDRPISQKEIEDATVDLSQPIRNSNNDVPSKSMFVQVIIILIMIMSAGAGMISQEVANIEEDAFVFESNANDESQAARSLESIENQMLLREEILLTEAKSQVVRIETLESQWNTQNITAETALSELYQASLVWEILRFQHMGNYGLDSGNQGLLSSCSTGDYYGNDITSQCTVESDYSGPLHVVKLELDTDEFADDFDSLNMEIRSVGELVGCESSCYHILDSGLGIMSPIITSSLTDYTGALPLLLEDMSEICSSTYCIFIPIYDSDETISETEMLQEVAFDQYPLNLSRGFENEIWNIESSIWLAEENVTTCEEYISIAEWNIDSATYNAQLYQSEANMYATHSKLAELEENYDQADYYSNLSSESQNLANESVMVIDETKAEKLAWEYLKSDSQTIVATLHNLQKEMNKISEKYSRLIDSAESEGLKKSDAYVDASWIQTDIHSEWVSSMALRQNLLATSDSYQSGLIDLNTADFISDSDRELYYIEVHSNSTLTYQSASEEQELASEVRAQANSVASSILFISTATVLCGIVSSLVGRKKALITMPLFVLAIVMFAGGLVKFFSIW